MLTDDDRKFILNELLNNVRDISDKEYQKRVWIRGEGPECDDFDETVCFFFDDVDAILDNYKKFGIIDSQYWLLMKFRNEFDVFSRGVGRNNPPIKFIESPEWQKIMEMAKEVLKAFNYTDRRKAL